MKKKILYTILTLTIGFTLISVSDFSSVDAYEAKPKKSVEEKTQTRACHDSFKALVDAMMKLKDEGVYTKEDIKALHKFYENAVSTNPNAIPTTDTGLLDAIFKANIITKTQYDQTLELLK